MTLHTGRTGLKHYLGDLGNVVGAFVLTRVDLQLAKGDDVTGHTRPNDVSSLGHAEAVLEHRGRLGQVAELH